MNRKDKTYINFLDQLDIISKKEGFLSWGISKPIVSDVAKKRLINWINHDLCSDLNYIRRNIDILLNPIKRFPWARSVIMLLAPWGGPADSENIPKVANYGLNRDYHRVLKKRLYRIIKQLMEITDFNYSVFVDSSPVMERTFAIQSGIGWMGKNGMIINPDFGISNHLCGFFTDLELSTDRKKIIEERCGDCKLCIDTCPTSAIVEPGIIDANRCIAYLTVEYRGNKRPEIDGFKDAGWIFGCDECIKVCPWTKKDQPSTISKKISKEKLLISISDGKNSFLKYIEGTPIRRIGYGGIRRNLLWIE